MNQKLFIFLCDLGYGPGESFEESIIAENPIEALKGIRTRMEQAPDYDPEEEEFDSFIGAIDDLIVYPIKDNQLDHLNSQYFNIDDDAECLSIGITQTTEKLDNINHITRKFNH